jgi:hypothetical protein
LSTFSQLLEIVLIELFKKYQVRGHKNMIISDLDYLEPIPKITAIDLNGSGALTISGFSAVAFGSSTYTGGVFNNLAISRLCGALALSSVTVISIASGTNTFASASASSIASAN